jgi:hypothetical protein
MGTRADFYIGNGDHGEWLGSIAYDGYEWENGNSPLTEAETPEDFRAAVQDIAKGRDDFTFPEDGWPWPWATSHTTDYSYVFNEGSVEIYCFGCKKLSVNSGEVNYEKEEEEWFPNMTAIQKVTLGPRSGVMIIHGV